MAHTNLEKSVASKVDPTVPIVIAAGGNGSRIGGSKHARLLAGQSLLDRAIDWANTHADRIAIAVRSVDQIAIAGIPLLTDEQVDIGPISALSSAFAFAATHNHPRVLVIGCDMPFLPDDLLLRLKEAIGESGCAMPVSAGKDHPMAAMWRVDRPVLKDYIANGGRSLWSFAEASGAVRVSWESEPKQDPFANINDERALTEARHRLKRQAR